MEKDRKIMFVCDRKKDCNGNQSCGMTCRHTADQDHALYLYHNNFLRDYHDKNLWWEVEE